MSYTSCIELRGPYDQLVTGLSRHVHQDCGLTFKAKCYEQGTREGSICVYERDAYPRAAIGRVSFIWDTRVGEKTRALWIWTEPLTYKQISDELLATFTLEKVDDDSNFSEWGEPPLLKKPKLVKIQKNIAAQQIPSFANGEIKMTLLKGTLNRLRLTGPLSNSVLNRVLYPANLVTSKHLTGENWWSSHTNSCKNSVNMQKQLWESFSGADRPESYPPNCVIGFHSIDPRLVFPKKKTKALPNSKGLKTFICAFVENFNKYYQYSVNCF